jgi:dCMP deaminase
MKNQISWDRIFMRAADVFAEISYDPFTKVGCIVVRDDNILSFSYNGTPSGQSNTMRDTKGDSLPIVLHAESNALLKMAGKGIATAGSTVYTTRCPCLGCAKIIYQANVERVVFRQYHSSDEGISFLEKVGIPVEKLS